MSNFTVTADRIADLIPMFALAKRVPVFTGRPGIAKTAFTNQAAAEMTARNKSLGVADPDVVIRELHLASMSEVDVRGYLIPFNGHATFTAPEFWSTVEKHQRGILFLDEFMQATPEVQKAVAPLILERRIGEYQLPEGWSIVLAGNGLEDGAGANALLTHIVNRVVMINVVAPDPDVWCSWAVSAQLAPELIAFAKIRPDVVFDSEIPSAANTPYCTVRSLHALADIAKAYPGGIRSMVDDKFGTALIAGAIGEGPASEVAAVVRTAINLPSYEAVVNDPSGTVLPTKPDQVYAMVMLLAVRAKLEHADQVVEYMARFQPNHAVTGIISLVRRDRSFARSKQMMNWVMANKSMLEKFGKYISESL